MKSFQDVASAWFDQMKGGFKYDSSVTYKRNPGESKWEL